MPPFRKELPAPVDIMKRVGILIVTLLFALYLCPVSYADDTVYVGEPRTFSSDSRSGSGTGSGTVDTRSEEQRAADSENLALRNSYNSQCNSFLDMYDLRNYAEWMLSMDNRYIFVSDYQVPKSDLEDLITNGAGETVSFNPRGSYYTRYIPKSRSQQRYTASFGGDTEAKSTFDGFVLNDNNFVNNQTSIISPGELTMPDQQYISIARGAGLYPYATIGGYPLLDTALFNTRINALDAFLAAWEEDVVNTRYIVEIHLESLAHNKLYTQVPNGFFGGATHWWKFEKITSDAGSIQPDYIYDNSTTTYCFPSEGRYHVSATQQMTRTYYDAMTISVNEYWVVETTGQVIYSREQYGGTISSLANRAIMDQSNINQNLLFPYRYIETTTELIQTYSTYVNVVNGFNDPDYLNHRNVPFLTERIA